MGREREGFEDAESLAQGQDQGNTGQQQGQGNKTENTLLNCRTRKLVPAKKKLDKAQSNSEVICTAASVHVDANVSVKEIISQMNTTMQTLFASLSDKMNEIERKLINKFNQQIDKRVNYECSKRRK